MSEQAAVSDATPSPSDGAAAAAAGGASQGDATAPASTAATAAVAASPSDPPADGDEQDLALSESGVSESFFASVPPPEPVDEHDWSEEQARSEYLTEEQLQRQRRSRQLVMLVLGGVALAAVVGLVRAAFDRGDVPPARRAEPVATSTATPVPTSATTAAPTVTTTVPTAAVTQQASAQPSASVSAAPATSAAADLPDVADPLAEAKNLLNIGRYSDAIPMARAAIAKDPQNGDGYFYLATALQSIGKNPEAIEVYSDCLATASRGQYVRYCKIYGKPR